MNNDDLSERMAADQTAGLSEPELLMAMDRLRDEQNLMMGVLAGLVAAVLGAAIWATATIATGQQIGWLAIGIGFLVGAAVGMVGKGIDRKFGFAGAALALVGCALGNLFTVAYFIAQADGTPYFELLARLDLESILEIMIVAFDPMDLLFYAFAAYFGYRYALREVTEADLARALGKGF
jgi:hypothetical protein